MVLNIYPSLSFNVKSMNEDKGRITESEFKNWLDNHKVPYWYIQQDIETFSPALKNYFAKRPDFMILIPNLSFIFVDVEYKKISAFGTFPIDAEEAKKYSALQRYFNVQVWFAVSNEECAYNTWYWIPVSKVLEIGETKENKHTSSKSKMEFFSVPVSEFIQIAKDDSLNRLFSKIM